MKTLKFLLAFSIALFSLSAFAKTEAEKCKYKDNCNCNAPGPTLNWEYAYCMAKLGVTDAKDGIDKLNKCSRKEMPSGYEKMSGCSKNQFWRTKFCELRGAGPGSECMTSDEQIPKFIETGK